MVRSPIDMPPFTIQVHLQIIISGQNSANYLHSVNMSTRCPRQNARVASIDKSQLIVVRQELYIACVDDARSWSLYSIRQKFLLASHN